MSLIMWKWIMLRFLFDFEVAFIYDPSVIKGKEELAENLVRFAHNWNVGILERWNNGFWGNGILGC